MDRQEFQEIVHKHAGQELVRDDRGRPKFQSGGRCETKPRENIEVEWCIGGLQGGNCWGGEANQPVPADPEPEFEELDEILLEAAPQVTYLQYKKLAKMIERDEYTRPDYYGNYDEFAVKRLSVDTLWDFLQTYKLV